MVAKSDGWKEPDTIWNKMFISIFLINVALNMGQQMSNSLLSLYAKSTGAPADQIGQLMSMFAVTALIFRFLSGPAMNSYNRKTLVIMAMCFMATAYIGFSFAPVISGAVGVEVIFVLKFFRLLQGVGNAFGNSCCLTIVSDALPRDKFTTGMSYYACALVISQAIGPAVGISLRDLFGYQTTYLLFFAIMLLTILAASLIKIAPNERIPFRLNMNNMIAREALVPAGVTFLVAMGFTSISSFLLVYAEERGIGGASLFFTVYAVTMLGTKPIVGKLTDRFGFVKVAIPSVFMTILSLVLIAYASNLPMLLLAAFVNAFGYGAVQPMLQSLCMKSVKPERRGTASGTNYISSDLATIIGPTVCGGVAAAFGYQPVMWLVMGVPIFGGVVFIFLFRKHISRIESAFL